MPPSTKQSPFATVCSDAPSSRATFPPQEWPTTMGLSTIRANLSRSNHLRIIEGLWYHRPSELYSQVSRPVLIMPARRQGDPAALERTDRRESSVEEAAKQLPKSKIVWLEDSIHDVPVQRPELVASVIKGNIQEGFFD